MDTIRNVAIIAHVDHGKTTLVDAFLRQTKVALKKELVGTDLMMDSNELEKERGITIFSKNASVAWKGVKINIIDTPGHADFGGEVERVLDMADGCLLVVDAKEGPMPQTRFVLRKAIERHLSIIVVINKIDVPDRRPESVVDDVLELFIDLGMDEGFADIPIFYASGRDGKAGATSDLSIMTSIDPLFDAILEHIPPPVADTSKPMQMLVTSVSADSFKGRIAVGKVHNGVLKRGQEVMHINRKGEQMRCRLTSVMTFEGLERIEVAEAAAGDIVAIAGVTDAKIGDTVADTENPIALPAPPVDEPTVRLNLRINDSPFAGREGTYSTARQLRERLAAELETDVALQVEENGSGSWVVSGRGELHLSILLERMRREGYELQASRPVVITKTIDGNVLAPYERVLVEVPDAFAGSVIQKLGSRHGTLQELYTEGAITFLDFLVPTRGLFGYRNEFLTDTKGLGIMHATFSDYHEDSGDWREREHGSLVAHQSGSTTLFGLLNAQQRGGLFFGPGAEVYKGQVVGQHSRPGDLRVNVCKEKELSNMRSRGEGATEHFNAPRTMGLEDALEYISDDELVEVTPEAIRIRKMVLDETEERRKRMLTR